MRINVLLQAGVPLEEPTRQVQAGHGNMHGRIWARVIQVVQARLRQAIAQAALRLAVQAPAQLHPAEAALLMNPGMHP